VRLTNYANACCLMEAEGFRILTDPWLVDGAFEGTWHHYPPLATRPEDLADVDALFISHVHPDHCDPQTLKAFRRDIPIAVLDHPPNFLHRVLGQMGFTSLVRIADGAQGRLGPFGVTLYAPFTTHSTSRLSAL
jgi:UDP-MurNAc hydroxylase